jgi:hypothetical protein
MAYILRCISWQDIVVENTRDETVASTVTRKVKMLLLTVYFIMFLLSAFMTHVVGLERRPLNLVNTIEELLGRKSTGSGLESREYGSRDPSR